MKVRATRIARLLGVGLVFFIVGFVVILALPCGYAIIAGLKIDLGKIWFIAFKGALAGAVVAMLLASLRTPSARDGQ